MNSRDWLELVLVPLTALVVTWVWNDRQSRADRYRFINEDYESLLALYLENPDLAILLGVRAIGRPSMAMS